MLHWACGFPSPQSPAPEAHAIGRCSCSPSWPVSCRSPCPVTAPEDLSTDVLITAAAILGDIMSPWASAPHLLVQPQSRLSRRQPTGTLPLTPDFRGPCLRLRPLSQLTAFGAGPAATWARGRPHHPYQLPDRLAWIHHDNHAQLTLAASALLPSPDTRCPHLFLTICQLSGMYQPHLGQVLMLP